MRSIHIHIETTEFGSKKYTVRAGDKYHDELTWDEMLGQVVHLSHPSIAEPRYDMLTAEQWAARDRLRDAENELRRAKDEHCTAFETSR